MATDVKVFILVPQSYLPMQCIQSIQLITITFFFEHLTFTKTYIDFNYKTKCFTILANTNEHLFFENELTPHKINANFSMRIERTQFASVIERVEHIIKHRVLSYLTSGKLP